MASLAGYNPNASLLPSGGGVIQPMSGGGDGGAPSGYNASASLLPSSGGEIAPFRGGFFMSPGPMFVGGEGETNNTNWNTARDLAGKSIAEGTNIDSIKDSTPLNGAATSDTTSTTNATMTLNPSVSSVVPTVSTTNDITSVLTPAPAPASSPVITTATTSKAVNVTPAMEGAKQITLFSESLSLDNPKNLKATIKNSGNFEGDYLKALELFGVDGPVVSPKEKLEILQAIYDGKCTTDAPLAMLETCEPIRRIVHTLALNLLGKMVPVTSKIIPGKGKEIETILKPISNVYKEEKIKVSIQDNKNDSTFTICMIFGKDQRGLISKKIDEMYAATNANVAITSTDTALTNKEKDTTSSVDNTKKPDTTIPVNTTNELDTTSAVVSTTPGSPISKLIAATKSNPCSIVRDVYTQIFIRKEGMKISELKEKAKEFQRLIVNSNTDPTLYSKYIEEIAKNTSTSTPEPMYNIMFRVCGFPTIKEYFDTMKQNSILKDSASSLPTSGDVDIPPISPILKDSAYDLDKFFKDLPTPVNIPTSNTPVPSSTEPNAPATPAATLPSKLNSDDITLRGIENKNLVSCYCNSVLQLLFSLSIEDNKLHKSLRDTILNFNCNNISINVTDDLDNIQNNINKEYVSKTPRPLIEDVIYDLYGKQIICVIKNIFIELAKNTTTFKALTDRTDPISNLSIKDEYTLYIMKVFIAKINIQEPTKKENINSWQDPDDLIRFLFEIFKLSDNKDINNLYKYVGYNKHYHRECDPLPNGSKIPAESQPPIVNVDQTDSTISISLTNTTENDLQHVILSSNIENVKDDRLCSNMSSTITTQIEPIGKYILFRTNRYESMPNDSKKYASKSININPILILDGFKYTLQGVITYVNGNHYVYQLFDRESINDSTKNINSINHIMYNDTEVTKEIGGGEGNYSVSEHSRIIVYCVDGKTQESSHINTPIKSETTSKLPNLNQFIDSLQKIIPTITFKGIIYSSSSAIINEINEIISKINEWNTSTVLRKAPIENQIQEISANLIEDIKKKLNSSTLSKDDAQKAVELHNLLLDILLDINSDYVTKTKGWKKIESINTYYNNSPKGSDNETTNKPKEPPIQSMSSIANTMKKGTSTPMRIEPLRKNNYKELTIPSPTGPKEKRKAFTSKLIALKGKLQESKPKNKRTINNISKNIARLTSQRTLKQTPNPNAVNAEIKTLTNKYTPSNKTGILKGGAKKTFKKSAAFKPLYKSTQKKKRGT